MSEFDRVIPLLVYSDIPAAHDFLVAAFGFESGGVERTPDGVAVHAEVRAGNMKIWLHRVTDEHELGSPKTPGVQGAGLVVYVDDVDAHFKRARAAVGAKIDGEPTDQPYGQREYGVRDPEGHRWWFASPLAQAAAC
jgi:MerR family transcriptional regulator, thiopeptide resistance regulator